MIRRFFESFNQIKFKNPTDAPCCIRGHGPFRIPAPRDSEVEFAAPADAPGPSAGPVRPGCARPPLPPDRGKHRDPQPLAPSDDRPRDRWRGPDDGRLRQGEASRPRGEGEVGGPGPAPARPRPRLPPRPSDPARRPATRPGPDKRTLRRDRSAWGFLVRGETGPPALREGLSRGISRGGGEACRDGDAGMMAAALSRMAVTDYDTRARSRDEPRGVDEERWEAGSSWR